MTPTQTGSQTGRRTVKKRRRSARLCLVAAAALLLLAGAHAAANVTATVDRTALSEVDLVTLTLRASGNAANLSPDFTPLEADFEIASNSTRQNSSISIVNGQATTQVYNDHVLALRPKRMGNLTIPAIAVGQYRTQPINISVQRQSAATRQRMSQLVFFNNAVDASETYVQGQVIYTVRLFYTEGIGGDFPQPPALEDAVVETIEKEKRYESIVGGRRYYVLEKRYAIFPQRSGELVIPGETFIGARGRGGLFTRRERVNAASGPHTVKVKRIPASFSGDHWIPAKSLTISGSWAASPPVFTVGEPVNRQLTISAAGLSDSLLPPLGEMNVSDAKIYADPPATTRRVGADGITAIQVTTIGIVPTSEGELTLPELRIPWWNTIEDREEVAVIPAETYQVMPAAGVAVSVPTVTVPANELGNAAGAGPAVNPLWQYVAAILGLLWIASTWQWFALRREMRALRAAEEKKYVAQFEDPDEARLFRELTDACRRGQAAQAHRQLFLWAKARFPDMGSVGELTKISDPLAQEVKRLEAALYSQGSHANQDSTSEWDGKALAAAADKIRNQRANRTRPTDLAGALNPA